jgi:hypothetical protein
MNVGARRIALGAFNSRLPIRLQPPEMTQGSSAGSLHRVHRAWEAAASTRLAGCRRASQRYLGAHLLAFPIGSQRWSCAVGERPVPSPSLDVPRAVAPSRGRLVGGRPAYTRYWPWLRQTA